MNTESKVATGISGRLKNTFRSLRYRNYRLFFTGQSISLIGTWIQQIAMPWLVYSVTDSVFLLGFIGFLGQIPSFLFSPFAGVLSDRRNRYHILIVTQILSMLLAFSMAGLYFSGTIEVWNIALLSFLSGCVNSIDIPARQSLIVEMVDDKRDLGNAIALNSSMVNGARLIGPSIAGFLIALTNEGVCFLVNGISYLFVICSLLIMKLNICKKNRQSKKIIKELKEGFSYTFGSPPIKSIMLLIGLVSLMGMPYVVLLPVFAREIFSGDSHTFGLLMGASGFGALTGALYLASRRRSVRLGRILPFSTTIFGLGLISFSFSHFFLLSIILMIMTGLGVMLQTASANTILQTIVDDDKRGRVMSFFTMSFIGMAPFGSLLAGSLAKIAGAPFTLAFGGLICLSGAFAFARALPELQKEVHPIYARMDADKSAQEEVFLAQKEV
ncbi:MAG: MFS transporter [Fibrobacter sp.]|nr:MFS transporter [Fibrobacter sp.]